MVHTVSAKDPSRSMNISAYAASKAQWMAAAGLAAAALLLICFTLPNAQNAWPVVQPFLPAFIAMVFFLDVTTSFLLFTEFFVSRRPALAILAAGYLFSALITIPHVISYPGLFAENGLLHASLQTPTWTWAFWHGGFPLFVIAYVLVDWRSRDTETRVRSPRIFAAMLLLLTVVLVLALSFVAYRLTDHLPVLIEKGNYTKLLKSGVGPIAWTFNLIALLCLLFLKRARTVLDLWLTVAIFAFFLDVGLTLFSGARYSTGWYVARVISFFSASVVLGTMLLEFKNLYTRAIRTNTKMERQSVQLQALNDQLGSDKLLIQSVIESVREGMMMCKAPDTIVYANRRMQELLQDNDAVIQAHMVDCLRHPEKERKERVQLNVSGESRYFELYALSTHLFGSNDDNGMHILVFRDRTEEENVEQIKNEFIGIVSHELRTPLTSIMGFVEIMLQREIPPERQKKYLTTVHKETTRLSGLINDFLDLQRMESGKQSLQLTHLELAPFIEEIVLQWQGKQGYTIELALPEQPMVVHADADRIRQVLDNLISNAIKYSPGQEKVDVRLGQSDGQVVIEVQDYGLGIPDEAKEKLFTKFFRVDNSDRRNIGGTGLGLAIVKEIVEMHHGQLVLESTHGQGSTFRVVLPSAAIPDVQGCILILEDDDALSKLIEEALSIHRLPIVTFRAAEEAILAIRLSSGQLPKICIVDFYLEGKKTGGEFVAELLRHPHTSGIPIIVASAFVEELQGSLANPENRLTKPYSMEDLIRLTTRMLAAVEGESGYIFTPNNRAYIDALANQGLEIVEIVETEDGVRIELKRPAS